MLFRSRNRATASDHDLVSDSRASEIGMVVRQNRMARGPDWVQDGIFYSVVGMRGVASMKRPEKKCSICKDGKDVNSFSPAEWKRVKGYRRCCACVKNPNPVARGKSAAVWSRSMTALLSS